MKKAIVTGATGFIGRFLVRELVKQGVDVLAVIRKDSKNAVCIDELGVRKIECNIVNFKYLSTIIKDRDIDALFHIAWQGVSDEDAKNQEIQLLNLNSTLDLIDVCNELGIKTFVGCGSMHEVEALVEMSNDKVVTNMGFMYKAAKTAAHWMGKAKCGSYGIRFFWPIINTYGEEETSARLVNTIIRKVFAGETPALSAGSQYYDFVHVSDVARALFLIAEKGINGTHYTIGSGEAKQLRDFLVIIGEVANELNGGTNVALGFGKITSNVIELPKDIFDIKKLTEDTGFIPSISFENGIRRTAEWIKKQCR